MPDRTFRYNELLHTNTKNPARNAAFNLKWPHHTVVSMHSSTCIASLVLFCIPSPQQKHICQQLTLFSQERDVNIFMPEIKSFCLFCKDVLTFGYDKEFSFADHKIWAPILLKDLGYPKDRDTFDVCHTLWNSRCTWSTLKSPTQPWLFHIPFLLACRLSHDQITKGLHATLTSLT